MPQVLLTKADMKRYQRILSNSKGESVVTFSLVIIPLVALMGLMITISMLIYANLIVIDATRDGARHKALNLDLVTGISTEQAICQSIEFARLPTAGRVTITIAEDANYVTVCTRYLQAAIIPRLPEMFGGSPYGSNFPIEARVTFKKERE